MDFRNFIPHGFCLAWDPGLVWLQAGSDALIALAYYSIPAALLVFLNKRRDLAFRPLFGLFAAFILACGTTHIFGVITLFVPLYWADGVLKAVTAALSVATAIVLWPLLPRALALPSPASLRALNARLEEEVIERDQTAARLRESEQRLRDLYTGSPAILHATDAQGTLLEVSRRWLDLFGTTREAAVGRSVLDFYEPGTVLGLAPKNVEALIADQRHSPRERRLALPNGEIRDAEAVYAVERDAAGAPRRIMVALTDVTPRKQAEAALRASEEKLRHAHKMEAIGQLTGGIAHDFNNLLTTIMASLEMLDHGGELNPRARRMANNALEGARRAARLTSQLLSFSRRSRLAPESMDPVAAVRGVEELLVQSIGGGIRLHIVPRGAPGVAPGAAPLAAPGASSDVWPVLADRTQLEVAVLNLVINARDAIAPATGHQSGGPSARAITIGFANYEIGREAARAMHPDPIEPGDYVGISVQDTGAGMAHDVLSRALEPFFTTKPAGAGTGLGLSQTYGFAIQSGGTLRITSQVGVGTQVEILLPRAAVPAQTPAGPVKRAYPSERGEVIVLAEDDALLRHTVGEVLRAEGYVVETAPDGRAALTLLQTLPHVDLLLTDVMMPGGMNGVELACAARGLSAGLRIMFATGYSDKDVLAQWHEQLDVVSKPFSLDELSRRVRTRLQEPAGLAADEQRPGMCHPSTARHS